MLQLRKLFRIGVVIASFSAIGCKQEDLKQMAEQVKEAATKKIESVKPKVIVTGQMKLSLDQPVSVELGRAFLHKVGDGRPATFQMRSYVDPDRETFPAILFQGPTTVGEINQSVGQTIRGKLFVQTGTAAPIWFTPDDQTVSVTVEKIDGTELIGTFSGGTLHSTQGKTMQANGTFRVVVPELTKEGAKS